MNRLKKAAIVFLFALLATFTALLVACSKIEKPNNPSKPTPDNKPSTPGAEQGVYYYDDELLKLDGLGAFELTVSSSVRVGTYTISGTELAFKFTEESLGTMVGSMETNAIYVTYNGASKRFYRQVMYTVTFNSMGGSAVDSVQVLNGGTISRPKNPTYAGKTFIGWYNDDAHTSPFAFNSDIITSNKTLFAYWVDNVFNVEEYVVDFDLGYANAEPVPSQTTMGGKIYIFPEVSNPDGSTLAGWWVSALDSGDADKLTYKYDSSIVLKENTTFHAVWNKPTTGGKLAAPLVSLNEGMATWNTVASAAGYTVSITSPDGTVATREVAGTSVAVNMPDNGEYKVSVTARASVQANNSEATVRRYVKGSLGRVSLFTVVGQSTLVYNAVEGAEKYLVTVKCGNAYHNHDNFDNGTSTYFNFHNCDMRADGIEFTVTAVAGGKLSSVSRKYSYKNMLDAIRGFTYDSDKQLLSWPQVAGATEYYVSVAGGAYNSIGNKTSVSLKEYTAQNGKLSVKVYPATNGCISPAAVEYVAAKSVPATPAAVKLSGMTLSWNAVANASYEVSLGSKTVTVAAGTVSLDLSSEDYTWDEGTDYTIKVRSVVGGKKSAWSDDMTARYGEMSGELLYVAGTLSWNPVLGAVGYEVTVNDGAAIAVTGTEYKVTLGRAGLNTLAVNAVLADDSATDAISTDVFAYAISLDSRGGSEVGRYEYKAIGDLNNLPTPTKVGYTFEGWYNTPNGADSNGGKYHDRFFNAAGEMVLYAYYTPNVYKVNYEYYGGTGKVAYSDVTYSKDYKLEVPVNEETGGIFGGWWSNPNGYGIQYTDEDGNSLRAWNEPGDKTLYAYWIEDVLKFNLLGDGKSYSVEQGSNISSVTKVRVPSMYNGLPVTTIEAAAFSACNKLVQIDIPESITLISSINPFEGCTALTNVNVYKVEGTKDPRYWSADGVLFDNGTGDASSVLKIMLVPAAKSGSYRIPDGVTAVASGVFTGSLITEIVIPTSVERIESGAFSGCANLKNVVFEKATATSPSLVIEAKAFYNCTLIEEITLPARLAVIELKRNTYTAAGAISGADMRDAFTACVA
ncbi:MAG: InlB B-repeat-containing protein, partial [Clostridiales bacterium]|nr:InlB B-repeat-containing protein [Clostridiales bacterium]